MNNFNQGLINNMNNKPNNSLLGNNFGLPTNLSSQNNYYSGINMYNLPRYKIIQVKGQNGAEAFQMAPDSNVLLLDENDPIVWFVQTDGAGYKTVTPYAISLYQPEPPVDLNSIEQRLSVLEEKINAKSYSGTSKQNRKQQSHNEQQSNGYAETTITAN